jgi:Arm domain-containing DNA-binding protein
MLIIKMYRDAAGREHWEYKIFYKDLNRETKCKRRRGFESQEQAIQAAEIMLGILRLPKHAYR